MANTQNKKRIAKHNLYNPFTYKTILFKLSQHHLVNQYTHITVTI
ncbi:MAG: hypothetical protein JWQ84_1985 [Mucilaginibacter sp.]|jgi:hypothetical protein|nr:hypothetical protein [Mucilaginibacter sp.]MDB5017153.1 hypothetical protein [Mucilaginibacter sp.]MDB5138309.1 hypothetical protein [Mucilaginibacter sp.]